MQHVWRTRKPLTHPASTSVTKCKHIFCKCVKQWCTNAAGRECTHYLSSRLDSVHSFVCCAFLDKQSIGSAALKTLFPKELWRVRMTGLHSSDFHVLNSCIVGSYVTIPPVNHLLFGRNTGLPCCACFDSTLCGWRSFWSLGKITPDPRYPIWLRFDVKDRALFMHRSSLTITVPHQSKEHEQGSVFHIKA